MSVDLAQVPAAAGWNVTTYIAAAGAVVSVATLVATTYFAGRRETVKWAREELAKAYFDFIDATYAATRASYRHHRTSSEAESADGATGEALREAIRGVRGALTRIRLLAPRRSVDLANEVRLGLERLSAGIREGMTPGEYERLRADVSAGRERLIAAAKKDMSLPE
ncbi:hypothetical protein GCM10009836_46220 [Pseudonocardia ailaonensis]|uniref:Uncharacterized protein n=1 Tax=Pseudonocardia ailaonensis TaxID=367279 RepID=A0ABN2NBY0_9PSEU